MPACMAAPPDVSRRKNALRSNSRTTCRSPAASTRSIASVPGEVEIVDYKTGKPKTDAQARNDLQLGIYALAAREDLELDPARLVYYNLQTNEWRGRDARR